VLLDLGGIDDRELLELHRRQRDRDRRRRAGAIGEGDADGFGIDRFDLFGLEQAVDPGLVAAVAG